MNLPAVKMSPHNLEAEEAVLGSILIDQSQVDRVKTIITPSDFFVTKNGMIYSVILTMRESNNEIDFLTLGNELAKRGWLDEVGGQSFLSHLVSIVPTSIHAAGYADIVAQTSIKRKLLGFCSEVAAASYNSMQPVDIIYKARHDLNQIAARVIDPAQEEQQQVNIVPELPFKLNYNPADGAGWMIDMYTNYASSIAPMSPQSFHETAALWIGGLVIARRLRAAMSFDDVYPNIFVVWVASSTVFHKTTALNVARRIIGRACPHLLLSSDITPQQLLFTMAGNEPVNKLFLTERDVQLWTAGRNFAAQRGMCVDEISGMMSSAGRDFNAGLIEYMMRLYNCEDMIARETRTDGLIVVRNSYLSLLGASTPMAMAPSMLNEIMWSNGWWPRNILVTPENEKPEFAETEDVREPDDLVNALQRLYNRLPISTWPEYMDPKGIIISPEAMKLWRRYYKAVAYDMISESLDHRINPVYGRLHIQALKAAMIMAAMDWGCGQRDTDQQTPTVELPHMARGVHMAEGWRQSAHRLLREITMGESNRFLQRVLSSVIASGQAGVTLRDLYKNMSRQPDEVERALEKLVLASEIEVFEGSNRKGGPRTKRYRRLVW